MSTPNLGLSTMPENGLQPAIPFNETMQLLDALLQPNVLDKDLTTPPTTVIGDVGKRWIVGSSATGAWASKDGQIALCVGADLWTFIVPKVGFRFFVVDEGVDYMYNGSSWAIVSAGGLTERVPIAISQSSVYSGMTAGTIADMRDGSPTTGTATNTDATAFIRLDLGEEKTVSMVATAGGSLTGWGGVATYINGCVLEYSTDDSTWVPLAVVSGASDSSPESSRLVFEPITARYWRLRRSGSYVATTRFQLYG